MDLYDGAAGFATALAVASVASMRGWRRLAVAMFGGTAAAALSRKLIGLRRRLFPLEAWIDSLRTEQAIDPERRMVDPHHHLWDHANQPKQRPEESITNILRVLMCLKPVLAMSALLKLFRVKAPKVLNLFSNWFPFAIPYMIQEFLRDIHNVPQGSHALSLKEQGSSKGHNVVATVYIESGWSDPDSPSEAMRAVGEARMAQSLSDHPDGLKRGICSGIVAHVNLSEGATECRHAFEELVKIPNIRGIRDSLFSTSKKSLFSVKPMKAAYETKFREAFALLDEFGLSYDCWLSQENIPSLRDLALAFPNTLIIADHCACPMGIEPFDRSASFPTWKAAIADLASKCPNVHVKLSGLAMVSCGFDFHLRESPPSSDELAEAWAPYILHCIDCFGVSRCMFASNFPVDKVSCSYTNLFNAMKKIVSSFSEHDKDLLFHGNANRVYRLGLTPR